MRITVSERKHRARARRLEALARSTPHLARAERARLLATWAREVRSDLLSPAGERRETASLFDVARLYGLDGELRAMSNDAVQQCLGGPCTPSISKIYNRWGGR